MSQVSERGRGVVDRGEDRRRHGISLVALALALFGSTTVIGQEGLISVLIPASAFFALAVGVFHLSRSGGGEE